MLTNLFKLRVYQFIRLIRHTGVGVVMILLFTTFGFTLSGLQYLTTITPMPFFMIAIGVLLVIHFKRNDLHFLQSITASKLKYRLALFVEYLMVLIPFTFFFLMIRRFELIIPIVGASFLAAILPSITLMKKSDTKITLSILPTACFEIKTHIEKNMVGYGLIALIGFLSALHISLFILFTLLFSANIFSAFSKLEPKEMITPTRAFLMEKIKRNISLAVLLTFPVLSIALIFQFQFIYVVTYFYLTIFLTITFGILCKYAHANPLYPQAKATTAQSLFFILPYLPGLIIANIGYQIYLWTKANKNLKQYYA